MLLTSLSVALFTNTQMASSLPLFLPSFSPPLLPLPPFLLSFIPPLPPFLPSFCYRCQYFLSFCSSFSLNGYFLHAIDIPMFVTPPLPLPLPLPLPPPPPPLPPPSPPPLSLFPPSDFICFFIYSVLFIFYL